MKRRIQITTCDAPDCPESAEGEAADWLRLAGALLLLDFCGWDCLVAYAIAPPEVSR